MASLYSYRVKLVKVISKSYCVNVHAMMQRFALSTQILAFFKSSDSIVVIRTLLTPLSLNVKKIIANSTLARFQLVLSI